MFATSNQAEEPAWTGFAMEQIMKTLSFVNSSLVQAPKEEKDKIAHKLDDTLYCAKVKAIITIFCLLPYHPENMTKVLLGCLDAPFLW